MCNVYPPQSMGNLQLLHYRRIECLYSSTFAGFPYTDRLLCTLKFTSVAIKFWLHSNWNSSMSLYNLLSVCHLSECNYIHSPFCSM